MRAHHIMRFLSLLLSLGIGLVLFVACARIDMGSPSGVVRHVHAPYAALSARTPPPRIRVVDASPQPAHRAAEADLPPGITCGLIRSNAPVLDANKPIAVQVRAGAAARGLHFTDAQIEAIALCLEKHT
jgi:hypothetical protein